MAKQLKIGNFKSFGKTQEINLKPITLIFGANSAGKSSIIQNLILIEEYLDKHTLDLFQVIKDQEVIDYGGAKQFLNQRSKNGTITLGGKVDLDFLTEWDDFKNYLNSNDSLIDDIRSAIDDDGDFIELEITTCLDWEIEFNVGDFDKIYITNIVLSIDEYEVYAYTSDKDYQETFYYHGMPEYNIPPGLTLLKLVQKSKSSPELRIEDFAYAHHVMCYFRSQVNVHRLVEHLEEYFNKSDIKILEDLQFDDSDNIYSPTEDMERVLSHVFKEIKNRYQSTYFGPWRRIPDRLYGNSDNQPNSWKRLFEDEFLRKRVNKLLLSLGIQYEVIIEKYHSELKTNRTHKFIALRDISNNSLISVNDVGTGISQILPILVALEDHLAGIIYVEQPELHLHPGLQAKWGKALKEASQSNFVIFETHSEHIIKSIQLEIMKANQSGGKDGIANEDVAILYVSRDENGDSIVKEMKLDKTGSFIEPWPDDFFEISADLSLERLRQSCKSKN